MLGSSIPFQVPIDFQSAVAAGKVARFGAVLKDTDTGQIVAHMQETGGMLGLLSGAGEIASTAAAFSPIGLAARLATELGQIAAVKPQLNRIEDKLGVLETLQTAGLATSVAGLGVTAASTAIILRRLRDLNAKVGDVAGAVGRLPDKWRTDDLFRTITRIETHLERLAEVPLSRNPGKVAETADEALHEGYNALHDRLMSLKEQSHIDARLFHLTLSTLCQCGAAQVRALFWLDDIERAKHRAHTQAMRQTDLARVLPADDLERRLDIGDQDGGMREAIIEDMLEMRRRIASIPLLASSLQARGVSGPEYLRELDRRTEDPILLLAPAPTA